MPCRINIVFYSFSYVEVSFITHLNHSVHPLKNAFQLFDYIQTMIFWMLQQREIAQKLQEKIAQHLSKAQRLELFFLAFIAIFREGIETVIFLEAARYATEELSLLGALLGVGAAIVLGFILFVLSIRINIKRYYRKPCKGALWL